MSRLYTGFGYWDVTPWALAFAFALLLVFWFGGLGRRGAVSEGPSETGRAERFPGGPLLFWEASSFRRLVGELPLRLWESLSTYREGWALVAMVFLLVLTLL